MLGRHRLQFLYQVPTIFSHFNQPALVGQMKSEAGFATVAGIELTLLDCVHYFHKAAGINGVAQIVKDIGAKASPRLLKKAAGAYENSAVRRLGYLLDLAGHARQADALQGFVKRARTALPLDPAFFSSFRVSAERSELNQLQEALRNGSLNAIQETKSYEVASRIATDSRSNQFSRSRAVQRMRELSANDAQRLDAVLIDLDLYLNGILAPAPCDSREVVERLLAEAESNAAKPRRLPQLRNARAKHSMRCNDFNQARALFDETLNDCLSDSCGDLPGLIARDSFALQCAVKPNGFSVDNCERYWCLMLNYEVMGTELSLQEAAKELESYFWEKLYRPYPGLQRHPRQPTSQCGVQVDRS